MTLLFPLSYHVEKPIMVMRCTSMKIQQSFWGRGGRRGAAVSFPGRRAHWRMNRKEVTDASKMVNKTPDGEKVQVSKTTGTANC